MATCATCGQPARNEHRGTWYCDTHICDVTVPAEVYSRIVGYLRPIQNWNAGKRQEFVDRRMFNVGGLVRDE